MYIKECLVLPNTEAFPSITSDRLVISCTFTPLCSLLPPRLPPYIKNHALKLPPDQATRRSDRRRPTSSFNPIRLSRLLFSHYPQPLHTSRNIAAKHPALTYFSSCGRYGGIIFNNIDVANLNNAGLGSARRSTCTYYLHSPVLQGLQRPGQTTPSFGVCFLEQTMCTSGLSTK